MKAVRAKVKGDGLAEWEDFTKIVPSDNDSMKFVEENKESFYIPFKDLIFSDNPNPRTPFRNCYTRPDEEPAEVAPECVAWENWGEEVPGTSSLSQYVI